ncbi:MAG: tagaturonate epimerase family protein [Sedimentisphaeraceae bacterium JB056]
MKLLEKYSFGIGDRFGHQAEAQLQAMIDIAQEGIDVTPVWNKSYREHTTIKTKPEDTRTAADKAIQTSAWNKSYYCDADHISLNNVELFTDACDFFTIDVADFIGQAAPDNEIEEFSAKYSSMAGELAIPGIDTLKITKDQIRQIARKVLLAVKEAGKIYKKIVSIKGKGTFITEISMDETDIPQSPVEMLFILIAIAEQDIPAQTIAPRFTGRFNKGVDYVGDATKFEQEFEQDAAVIRYAVNQFNLPKNLKLSVHSGSDKFSIYPAINRTIKKYDTGIHVKTAGTSWLEEIIGLSRAGGKAFDMAKRIYKEAYERYDELCKPYAAVIDINPSKLPTPSQIDSYSSELFSIALEHNPKCPQYNPDLRQLIHVGYKVAAELGSEYTDMLKENKDIISECVRKNILEKHIKPIFC